LQKLLVSFHDEWNDFSRFIAGSEVGNGFSELNDPLDQRARFEMQQELLAGGDDEAMMPEWDFVEMLEHGMPPTCGFGFGERLFAFLEDKPLREVPILSIYEADTCERRERSNTNKPNI
jgi:lysyl-tRNA synthetase class 2